MTTAGERQAEAEEAKQNRADAGHPERAQEEAEARQDLRENR